MNYRDQMKIKNQPANKNACKVNEEDVHNDKALVEAIFDSVPGMIYLYTEEGALVRWNKRSEELTGFSGEELAALKASDFFDREDLPIMTRAWEKVFAMGHASVELNHIMKGGFKVPYLLTGVRVEIDGKPHLVGIGIDLTEKKEAEEERERAQKEIVRLKDLLEAENIYLKKDMQNFYEQDGIIGKSDAIQYVLFRARQVALTDATVFITGETGTGKGRVARLIHQASQRKDKPMVMVNCAGLPGNLIESELFGREKGAFTGAEAKQIGRFELADGGTIFLDEIAELPVELQAKLLRVIEDGEFERLGSPHTVKVDVRIIASTNRNLREEIRNGRFREDLFYRLNIFPITVPSLRQRREDIPLLVRYYAEKCKTKYGKPVPEIPEETMRSLQSQEWPGNVRELMAVIERAVITSRGVTLYLSEKIVSDHQKPGQEMPGNKALADVERAHIDRLLKDTGWKIEGPNGAARLLGLNPSTLRNRMKKLGIKRPGLSKHKEGNPVIPKEHAGIQ